MSVAVSRASFDDILMPPAAVSSSSMACLLPPRQKEVSCQPDQKVEEDDRPEQLDVWTSIHASKKAAAEAVAPPPYVHPLLRRSSSSLSQNSLETCTENLGSETGSDVFSYDDDKMGFPFFATKDDEDESNNEMLKSEEDEEAKGKELKMVNYHCSIGRRTSQPRQFPPPLPSISRRDRPCLSMRPHRSDGRLVVEAVPVVFQNYLQAERQDGRLLLSFINTLAAATSVEQAQQQHEEQSADHEELVEDDFMGEEEEEEEVEVVERGTVVEVKVSGGAASKVLRSTLVINKFVGAIPLGNQERWAKTDQQQQTTNNSNEFKEEYEQSSPPHQRFATSPLRRIPSAISTMAAVAAVAETALSAMGSGDVRNYGRLPDNKVLFTSKRRNREELLHKMRRCSQLRRPLFIWEPYCIAASS